jgi:hypothetical protein
MIMLLSARHILIQAHPLAANRIHPAGEFSNLLAQTH